LLISALCCRTRRRFRQLVPTPSRRINDTASSKRINAGFEQHAAYLWPALTAGTGASRPHQLEPAHDPDNRNGAARLDWQYFRANVEPSDRFVLSSVGATRFRLRPDQSEVGNLYLAGDWTQNKFNGGPASRAR
jgi:hypothetical protein